MNQQLLELLQQSEGYCSGEAISEQMGITRSAVWKQINQLRQEGYEIDSDSNNRAGENTPFWERNQSHTPPGEAD